MVSRTNVSTLVFFAVLISPCQALCQTDVVEGEAASVERIAEFGGQCEIGDNGHVVSVVFESQSEANQSPKFQALINNDLVQEVANFSELEILSVDRPLARGVSLEPIAGLEKLRELLLEDAPNVTDEDVKHLTSLGNLEVLHLRNSKMTDESLRALSQLSNLRVLRVSGSAITEKGIRWLARLSKLESLSFRGSQTVISDAELSYLAYLPNLEALSVGGPNCEVTDVGLEYLTHLPLTNLGMKYAKITDEGAKHLGKLKNLDSLYIQRSSISDRGLSHLSGLPLRQLGLVGCRNVTDTGAAHLAKIDTLESLWLTATSVTNDSLKHFDQMKSLKAIYFPPAIHGEPLQQFHENNPGLRISVWIEGGPKQFPFETEEELP